MLLQMGQSTVHEEDGGIIHPDARSVGKFRLPIDLTFIFFGLLFLSFYPRFDPATFLGHH